jgi:uncharacterized protein (DUF362 family)
MSEVSSKIAVVNATYENVLDHIGKAIDLIGPVKIGGNKTVVIKINMCDARLPETGTITHPKFLEATLHYLRKNYDNLHIIVVESDATVTLADKFIKWFGFSPVLEKWDAKFINLSKTKIVERKIDGKYFKLVPVSDVFEKSDFFITMPKPKTNVISTITCCLKNQFGCLPVAEKGVYHPHISDVIADVNSVIRPDLCLVDGIIAMGSPLGPSFGVPIPMNSILCSTDPVATDAYCARLMGFNPSRIEHIRKSASSGVGSMKYTLCGDKIGKIDFEINKIELSLIKFASHLSQSAQKKFRAEGRKKS